jgi:hypothetical protein
MPRRFSTLIRVSLAATGTLGLFVVACGDPSSTAPVRVPFPASHAAVRPSIGRYLVLVNPNGFGSDFADIVASLGGSIEAVHNQTGFAVVSGLSAAGASQLGKLAGADVEPDVNISLGINGIPQAEADASNVIAQSVLNPTTAALYSWQWNMRSIKANVAWANGKLGDAGVTVAIIDSGLDYDDPDLNGLVDLARSTSFVASDNALRATYFPTRNDISDFNGHGTNVAEQVSSKAVVLAAVTSKTTLIGVKVLDRTGVGPIGTVLTGILWAADHGADVANLSLGGSFSKAGLGTLVSIINRVFNYANQKGMLIVVAAGNDAANLDTNGNSTDFCDAPHAVCVSSVGPALGSQIGTPAQDMPAFYTNFGRSVISVASPGGNANPVNNGFTVSAWPWGNDIASWVWSFCSKTSIAGLTSGGAPILTSCAAGNRLSGYIGTSEATAHVSGLAALLVADHGRNNPSVISQLIASSADPILGQGVNPFFGAGRINVARALGY